jgi:RsiW-degrading membrane proteinase PrsW (M82 family)
MTAADRPSALDDAAESARREAIAVSGWGAPFRFVQPHNACFWLYLLLVGSGIWKVITLVAPTAGIFAQANATAFVTSGLLAAVFLAFLHGADRWERTPALLAALAFLVGGFGAAFAIALPGNTALAGLYAKLFGQSFALDWQAGLSAPFVEETAKGAAFLLLLGLAPVVVRTVYDGLIVGAYTGLGFQVLEDMLYGQNAAAAQFGVNQTQAVLGTFALRALTSVASHALYTALFAAGLIYLIGTVAQPRRAGRGVALVLTAVVIHAAWDSAAALGGSGPLTFVIMGVTTVVSVAAVFVALRLGAGRERGFMRAIMTPEVANGTISAAELDALAGDRRDRRSAVRHRPEDMSRRRERHVLHAARDLANDLCVGETAQVAHSRAEIARLRER